MRERHSQLNLPPTLVKSLDPPDQSLDLDGQSSLTSLLAASVETAGCTEKEAARDMGYDPAYWTRIKAGDKAAHLERLSRLPQKVQREFVKRYAHELKMHVTEGDSKAQMIAEFIEVAARVMREIA